MNLTCSDSDDCDDGVGGGRDSFGPYDCGDRRYGGDFNGDGEQTVIF